MPNDAPDWTTGTQPGQRVKLYPDGTPANQMGPAPTFPSFTVAANGAATKTFTLKPAQTNVRLQVVGSNQFRLNVQGHQTSGGYMSSVDVQSGNFASANSPFRPIDIRVEPDWDSQVDITVTEESGLACSVYVSALFGSETVVLAGATTQVPVFSIPTTPPLRWQAGTLRAVIPATSVANGGTLGIVAGVAGQTIYPGAYVLFQDGANAAGRWTLQDTTPSNVHDMLCTNVRGLLDRGTLEGVGLPGGAGKGFQILNSGGAASFISGFFDYQQF